MLKFSIRKPLHVFLWAGLSVSGIGWAVACEGDGEGCVDLDLDGFGSGCAAGPDCDDRNALRNVDCDGVPSPDCTETPFATGCPCLAGAATECYPGDLATRDVGLCRGGRTVCVNQRWGLCEGSNLPRLEFCDGLDQDCDAQVDEGVASPCGDCDSGCVGAVWGPESLPFADPTLPTGSNLDTTDAGFLTLAFATQQGGDFVWVPSSDDGILSKIDALSAVEVARYQVGAQPSRIAVDYRGDAFVANRAFDGIPTVVKIAAAEENCIDRNNNTVIETSTGPGDVLPEGADECVLFSVPVGPEGSVARALAIDGSRDEGENGRVWVGLFEGQEIVAIHGDTGAELARLPTPGFSPYGAAFDRFGTLWLLAQDGLLLRVDRRGTPTLSDVIQVPLSCFLLYSFAIHQDGRLFLSGHHCDQALRFDPVRDQWIRWPTEESTRGVTVAGDRVYMSHTAGLLSELDAQDLRTDAVVDLHALGETPIDSIGLSVDRSEAVWISSGFGGDDHGFATRVTDGVVTAQVPVGRGPHTQGDLTGSQLLGGFAEEGQLRRVFAGCGADVATQWERIHLFARPGAAGSIEVRVRHGDDSPSLQDAAFVSLGRFPDHPGPYPLGLPEGGLIEVEVVLRTEARDGAPRVERVGIEWNCPGPI